MATIPNGDAEQKFQAMLANLLTPPSGWSEKQQLELEMASRDASERRAAIDRALRGCSFPRGRVENALTQAK